MNIAVYPGTFDPVTNGHIDVIKRAASMFNNVFVVVANNPKKVPTFSKQERVILLEETLYSAGIHNAFVDMWDGLIADYARRFGPIVRGIRAVTDFDYEFQMALVNKKLGVETIFLPTSEKYVYLSSSMVKQIFLFGEDISDFVPECVELRMKERFKT